MKTLIQAIINGIECGEGCDNENAYEEIKDYYNIYSLETYIEKETLEQWHKDYYSLSNEDIEQVQEVINKYI